MVIDAASILRRAAQVATLGALAGLAAACGSAGQTAASGHHHHHSGGQGAGGAAAGSTYYPLELTNVSGSSCHVFGYPGVSASSGHQVGKAASRNPSTSPQAVVLAPGATAHALLQVTDVSNVPPASCKPVTASGLQVYPPDQFSAAFIPVPLRACSGTSETFLSVSPVQQSVGVPGHP